MNYTSRIIIRALQTLLVISLLIYIPAIYELVTEWGDHGDEYMEYIPIFILIILGIFAIYYSSKRIDKYSSIVVVLIALLLNVGFIYYQTSSIKHSGPGTDAKIRSRLHNARAQSELYADNNNNSFAGVCATSSGQGILAMKLDAISAGSPAAETKCGDNSTGWAMEAKLKPLENSPNRYYCVDSSGVSTTTTSSRITDGANSPDIKC